MVIECSSLQLFELLFIDSELKKTMMLEGQKNKKTYKIIKNLQNKKETKIKNKFLSFLSHKLLNLNQFAIFINIIVLG